MRLIDADNLKAVIETVIEDEEIRKTFIYYIDCEETCEGDDETGNTN